LEKAGMELLEGCPVYVRWLPHGLSSR
jgi:hypothetical protein